MEESPTIISRETGFGAESFYDGPKEKRPSDQVYALIAQVNERIIRSTRISGLKTIIEEKK